MAAYEIKTLDVWGNAVEGYEVNDSSSTNSIIKLPEQVEDPNIIQALIDSEVLPESAQRDLEEGGLTVENDGDIIEVNEVETAWGAVDDQGRARYVEGRTYDEAAEHIEETEGLEEFDTPKPLLQLWPIEPDPGSKPFLRKLLQLAPGNKMSHVLLELRWLPGAVQYNRFIIDVFVDSSYMGGMLLGTLGGADLGPSKDGIEVEGPPNLDEEAAVALDAFNAAGQGVDKFILLPTVEKIAQGLVKNTKDLFKKTGGISHEQHTVRNRALWELAESQGLSDLVKDRLNELQADYHTEAGRAGTRLNRPTQFIAQQYGPQSGYAYVIDISQVRQFNPETDRNEPLHSWNEADDESWDTAVVDQADFGAEVGVVVIDGVEMRVWERRV